MTKKIHYTGNKMIAGVYHKIINNIPEHTHYYEVFAGSGAIGLHLFDIVPKPVNYVFMDIDPEVRKYYREQVSNFQANKSGIYFYPVDYKRFLAVLPDKARAKDLFYFIDPPYLLSTRSGIVKYNFELTDEDHIDLLSLAKQLPGNVMIIHPECELYNNSLSSWRKIKLTIRYHRKTSNECLYMNYPYPEKLQTYKYLGSDCWDRQRIKRQSERIIQKFDNLHPTVRNNVLQLIKAKYF